MMRQSSDKPDGGAGSGSTSSGEPSGAILERLARGEIAALEEVVELYGDRVFSVCLGILGNHADAEDASQEVFLRAFQQASKFNGRSRYSTWLLRVAANHTLNRAKAATRRLDISGQLEGEVFCNGPAPDQAAMGSERREALARLLQQVPLDQRQVLVLREMEGLSYGELSQVLGIPVGTVTSRLVRGREKLRSLIRELGADALT